MTERADRADRRIRSVCVYCGSSPGFDEQFSATACDLGILLAEEGITLVYGGGAVGLMGTVADAALAAGGEVVGVIPRGLFRREIAHHGLTTLHEVDSMHERKQLMADLADAFVALPGGLGTLEELAEVTTWAQLGIHDKPIAVLDVGGYWRPLATLLDHAVEQGFLHERNRALMVFVDRIDDLLPTLRTHEVPYEEKWLSRRET